MLVKRGFGAFYNLFLSLVIVAKFAQAINTGSYFLGVFFRAGDNKIDCNKTKLGIIAVLCSADSSHQTESSFQNLWEEKEEQAGFISLFH